LPGGKNDPKRKFASMTRTGQGKAGREGKKRIQESPWVAEGDEKGERS